MRELRIIPVLNGWVVAVGCRTVVFNNRSNMLIELEEYIKNPKDVEKRYLKNAVNKTNVDSNIVSEVEQPADETNSRRSTFMSA